MMDDLYQSQTPLTNPAMGSLTSLIENDKTRDKAPIEQSKSIRYNSTTQSSLLSLSCLLVVPGLPRKSQSEPLSSWAHYIVICIKYGQYQELLLEVFGYWYCTGSTEVLIVLTVS